MTPKEKANELVVKYIQYTPVEYEIEYAKKCALIHVNGLINDGNLEFMKIQESLKPRLYEYWIKVKQEIELL